jgi:FixJ family two-component response regulator
VIGSVRGGLVARIFIIDDDEAVRDSTQALLESHGHEVHKCASAEDFLSRWNGVAGCLIVDQTMSGMTGLDLLEQLCDQGDQTPALLITGDRDPILEPRAKRIGVKLLHKPVPEDEFMFWVEIACRG